jgi:hypothetical protein
LWRRARLTFLGQSAEKRLIMVSIGGLVKNAPISPYAKHVTIH